MKKKRKKIIAAVTAVIVCTSAVAVSTSFKKSRERKLLTKADMNLSAQQKNIEIPKEEQREITNEEEYEERFVAQSEEKRIEGPNTYKISNDKCSISFDSGDVWIDIPIDIKQLTSSAGYLYKNKLQDGSFIINPKYTAICYGGTEEVPLSIIFSNDSGQTWKSSIVDTKHQLGYVRVKIVSFVNEKCGYIIASSDTTVCVESKSIFKTDDGGETWKKIDVKTDITGHLLYNAGFISEDVGFMSMVSQDEPILYRTDNGGRSWETVNVEFTDDSAVQPSVPYVSDNKLCLEIGTYMSGEFLYEFEKSAVYESNDSGKTFRK